MHVVTAGSWTEGQPRFCARCCSQSSVTVAGHRSVPGEQLSEGHCWQNDVSNTSHDPEHLPSPAPLTPSFLRPARIYPFILDKWPQGLFLHYVLAVCCGGRLLVPVAAHYHSPARSRRHPPHQRAEMQGRSGDHSRPGAGPGLFKDGSAELHERPAAC